MPTKEEITTRLNELKRICSLLEDLASDEDLHDSEYYVLSKITEIENHDWDSNILAHFIDGIQLGIKWKESEVKELKDKYHKLVTLCKEKYKVENEPIGESVVFKMNEISEIDKKIQEMINNA